MLYHLSIELHLYLYTQHIAVIPKGNIRKRERERERKVELTHSRGMKETRRKEKTEEIRRINTVKVHTTVQ